MLKTLFFLIKTMLLFLIPRRGCGHVGNQQVHGAVGMVLAKGVQVVGSLPSIAVHALSMAFPQRNAGYPYVHDQ